MLHALLGPIDWPAASVILFVMVGLAIPLTAFIVARTTRLRIKLHAELDRDRIAKNLITSHRPME
jgi:hypothetical protein